MWPPFEGVTSFLSVGAALSRGSAVVRLWIQGRFNDIRDFLCG